MTLKFEQSILTDVGLVREANEDSMGYFETINGHLFVVCDGMGGHVGGSTASTIAVESISTFFSKEKYENLYIAINDAIKYANTQIFERATEDVDLKGMGTTVVVLLIQDDKIYFGYVGDSRIYIHTDEKLRRITKDHSFVQGLVDQGLISDHEAENHPRKNELMKVLGVREEVEVTVCSEAVIAKTNDVFMLCSDGLCGLVNDMTMEGLLNDPEKNLDQKVTELVDLAKNAGGTDNITVQLVKITESEHKETVFTDLSPKETINTHEDEEPVKPKCKYRKLFLAGYILGGIIILGLIYYFVFCGNGKSDGNGKNIYEMIDQLNDDKSVENDEENDEENNEESDTTDGDGESNEIEDDEGSDDIIVDENKEKPVENDDKDNENNEDSDQNGEESSDTIETILDELNDLF